MDIDFKSSIVSEVIETMNKKKELKKYIAMLENCPYCGFHDYELIKDSEQSGMGTSEIITSLICNSCGTITTHKDYYNTFNLEKYNRRCLNESMQNMQN